MLRLCAAVLLAVYAEYEVWYVTPDVISFASELGVGMCPALGSHANVCDCLELFKSIESARFEQWPSSIGKCMSRSIDHHTGRIGAGGDDFIMTFESAGRSTRRLLIRPLRRPIYCRSM